MYCNCLYVDEEQEKKICEKTETLKIFNKIFGEISFLEKCSLCKNKKIIYNDIKKKTKHVLTRSLNLKWTLKDEETIKNYIIIWEKENVALKYAKKDTITNCYFFKVGIVVDIDMGLILFIEKEHEEEVPYEIGFNKEGEIVYLNGH